MGFYKNGNRYEKESLHRQSNTMVYANGQFERLTPFFHKNSSKKRRWFQLFSSN